jgi:PAS domain-containing protein
VNRPASYEGLVGDGPIGAAPLHSEEGGESSPPCKGRLGEPRWALHPTRREAAALSGDPPTGHQGRLPRFTSLPNVPFFICPNCGNRVQSGERTAGLSSRPKGCPKCGFGFLFELLDDYYPAPDAAFFTCDGKGRVLDVGRGGFELTGLTDEDVIGRPVKDVLGLEWIDPGAGGEVADSGDNGVADPIETTLEWGVRSLGKRVAVHAEGDLPAQAVADVFPAYDDDGGMLLVLTPE